MDGTAVLAQGFTYVQNGITSYESAVLLTNLASGFPNFLPDENSTAIIIAANTGRITQFRLANLSFKYTSTPSQSVGFVDPNVAHYLLAYYLLFLFITPVAAVILVTRVFKTEN